MSISWTPWPRPPREAVVREDYCHAVEHSIEFQVVFLQHVLGQAARIVPVLCGPFAPPEGGAPEDDPGVARFLEALRALLRAAGRPLRAGRGPGPPRAPLRRPPPGPGRRGRPARGREGRPRPARSASRGRRARLLVAHRLPGRRPQLVRDVALLHLPARGSPRGGRGAALRAVADRSRKRRELRRPGLLRGLAPEDE